MEHRQSFPLSSAVVVLLLGLILVATAALAVSMVGDMLEPEPAWSGAASAPTTAEQLPASTPMSPVTPGTPGTAGVEPGTIPEQPQPAAAEAAAETPEAAVPAATARATPAPPAG